MRVGFYFPTVAAPSVQWVFSRSVGFPQSTALDYPKQLIGETAGGTVHVQDKGFSLRTFELLLERLTQEDHDAARNFFETVRQAFHAFEFVDRKGAVHRVRWMNGFDFREVAHHRYSTTLQLRQE